MIPRFLIEVPDQSERSDDLPPERRTLIPQHPRRQTQRVVETSQTEGCCVCGRLRGAAVRGPAGSQLVPGRRAWAANVGAAAQDRVICMHPRLDGPTT